MGVPDPLVTASPLFFQEANEPDWATDFHIFRNDCILHWHRSGLRQTDMAAQMQRSCLFREAPCCALRRPQLVRTVRVQCSTDYKKYALVHGT